MRWWLAWVVMLCAAIVHAQALSPGMRVQVAAGTALRALPTLASTYPVANAKTLPVVLRTLTTTPRGSVVGGPREAEGAIWWRVDLGLLDGATAPAVAGWVRETELTVTIPDTQAPSIPVLTTKAVSPVQVNLTWKAATDDVGVVAYDVYRDAMQIASTASLNYQDVGLTPQTQYTYAVLARDLAGNRSQLSATASVTTLAPQPNPLATMPLGTWYQVPASKMRDVAFAWPAGIKFGAGGLNGLVSQSGAGYDVVHDRLILWGGGHDHYAGNELYAFDLATLQWQRWGDPWLLTDSLRTTQAAMVYPDTNGLPDPTQPRTGHTANYVQWIPALDRFCSLGLANPYPGAGASAGNVFCFDVATKRWEQRPHLSPAFHWATSDYDPTSGLWWVRGSAYGGTFASWEPVSDTWTTRIQTVTTPALLDHNSAIDTQRQQFVTVMKGSPNVLVIDLTATGQLTERAQPTTGATEILTKTSSALWSPGFVYIPTRDRFVAWQCRPELGFSCADLYELDPSTWTWARTVPAASNTVVPTAAHPAGTYSHLRYVPSQEALIVVNSVDEPVYLYKLGESDNAPPPIDPPPGDPPPPPPGGPPPPPVGPPPADVKVWPSLEDEKATYQRWGWTWTASQEPTYPHAELKGKQPFIVTGRVSIHGDTEGDDTENNLQMCWRTGQQGYCERAAEFARYYRDEYAQCKGAGGGVLVQGQQGYDNTYCYDKQAFLLDHAYGWGLIAYGKWANDPSYLAAAEVIGADVEATHAKDVPGKARVTSNTRRYGRHLLLITRLAESTGKPRWIAFRDRLIDIFAQAPDWNAQYGAYFMPSYLTDRKFGAGSYAAGLRHVSSFQLGILTMGMEAAYQATKHPILRERLVAMAYFVNKYAMDQATQYVGYDYGVNITTGEGVNAQTWQKTPDQYTAYPEYTTTQVDTLVQGYKKTGDPALLAQAQHFYNRGTKGVHGSLAERTAPDDAVAYFIDTKLDGSRQYLYLWPNKGACQYACTLFENGGQPTVESDVPPPPPRLFGTLTITLGGN